MALRIVILLHFLKKYIYLIINPFKCFFFYFCVCCIWKCIGWFQHLFYFLLFIYLFIYFLIPPRNDLGFLTGRALLVNNLLCTLPERIFQLKPEDRNVRLSPASLGGHILQWVCLPKMSVCHSKQKPQQWYFFLFLKNPVWFFCDDKTSEFPNWFLSNRINQFLKQKQ